MTEKKSTKVPAKKRAPRKSSVKKVSPPLEEEKKVSQQVFVRELKTDLEPPVHHTKKKSEVPSPSLSFYRRLVIGFVGIVVLVLLTVLYFSTLKVTITVTPVSEDISTEFVVDIVPVPVSASEIKGIVATGSIGRTQTFVPTGEGSTEMDDIAKGMVTIYNTSSASQTLVKTTRLLTPEEVLFRLEEGVTVPAGGSVEAVVYADEVGALGNIAPTTFTIPGLSQSKQALIYAESTEVFTGGVRTIAVVTQTELDTAAETLKSTLVADALSMLRAQAGEENDGVALDVQVVEETYSIEPGTQAESYEVTLSLVVTAVFYDEEVLKEISEEQLYAEMGQGRQLVSTDEDGMEVSLEKFDVDLGNANLHVVLMGKVMTSRTSDALEIRRFVGMNEQEIQTLLLKEGVATQVRMYCFPFWVHKVPRFMDHVYLEIE